ncbi:MAG TPA: alpha/beta fold hydrolase [Terriglobales bacterium]|nr:alpha/beta fold hydrolase [Terriglobales bacterium]
MSPPAKVAPPKVAGTEECWATLDGHRLRYLRAGAGPPLLLLHGLLGYSFSWRFNFAALGRLATLYAPDLLGMGFSDRPPLDYGLRASAQRVLRFLDELGIGQADVLGTSHGGAVALRLAALAAERGAPRVRRLLLVAPVNPWSPIKNPLVPFLRTPLGRFCLRRLGPRLAVLNDFVLRRLYGSISRLAPGTLAGYHAAARLPYTADYVYAILDAWSADLAELERELPRLRSLPSLLLWGNRDRAVSLRSAERLRACFQRARLVVLPGVGHLPYEEVPEEFNRVIADFLAAPSGEIPAPPSRVG